MSYINKEQAIDLIESMIADKGVAFNPHKLAMALKDMESVEIPEAKDADLISRQAAIEALTGWQTDPTDEEIMRTLKELPPVTPTEKNEEDILKFYYVESIDEYWIGQRCGTRYYGKWTGNCFTFGYSRYLPWGEHVVAPDTLWKEHTYPSEPKEIPFNEWLQGFLEKECQPERTGWIPVSEPPKDGRNVFLAHGTNDFKSCCIGHYDHSMGIWYEDKNFFAKPIYDCKYWCDIPELPDMGDNQFDMRGENDE